MHVAAARRIFAKERVFVPVSVMLESEWVLRSNFGFERSKICDAFDRLLGLDTVTIQEVGTVEDALSSMRDGMDFADALHLYSSANCDVFYTFDKELIRKAKGREPAPAAHYP
ncbi:type II toxin-antitoxin system VapC family toxin [Mesorhizobium marinum]|uniref:type II toxin-antitoxin system VapC family toxin n=1 Tax=Mesorhizobium marinum TaxID=3228790 RepID=UPI003467234D